MSALVIHPETENRIKVSSFDKDKIPAIILDIRAGLGGRFMITFSFPQITDPKGRKAAQNTIIATDDGEIVAQECIPEGVCKT